jgi:hypothetical protein
VSALALMGRKEPYCALPPAAPFGVLVDGIYLHLGRIVLEWRSLLGQSRVVPMCPELDKVSSSIHLLHLSNSSL